MQNIRKNAYTYALALTTVLFGISLILQRNTYIRLIEPPTRWLLILACFVLPTWLIWSNSTNRPKGKSWSVIGIAALWAGIAALYVIHPVQNGGWALCLGISLLTLATLSTGDWRGG
ncbi:MULTISPECIES: hypothetical protein [Aerococcus]|uniref:Uncharacterized protein n=1 Tax=Aerococcus mictus TaxID=2976810 RepID=A0A1E9PPJ8_9LACT|nr:MULTISPECIES: hypothetical protein [Aerococcus]KAA9232810.1 hypothetical protein F6I37_07030 [Aerococcus mictus]KAA9292908.1 hypothetical protein F6I06_02660 [Aerococcus mictus]MBU5610432.1 hypothetical protein [Aerococcus urinae]MCY3064993.1 hypothetical protein [Aerococcus mictus]MCY3076244.1 hypothetical protein [Aerococcus mictus]